MSDHNQSDQEQKVTKDELEEQDGEQLPPREVMSVIELGEPVGGGLTLPYEPPEKS